MSYPVGADVEVRYPLTKEQEQGDRAAWPWLPGWIAEVCGPDEWEVCVEDRRLAMVHQDEIVFPCCFRDSSELRIRRDPDDSPQPAGRGGQQIRALETPGLMKEHTMPDNDTTEINDIPKTTAEQVQALNKTGYELYCQAERLAEQAIAAWPYPDLAEELRMQLAGSLEELARQVRGDSGDDGDVEAHIAEFMAGQRFSAERDARLSDESGSTS